MQELDFSEALALDTESAQPGFPLTQPHWVLALPQLSLDSSRLLGLPTLHPPGPWGWAGGSCRRVEVRENCMVAQEGLGPSDALQWPGPAPTAPANTLGMRSPLRRRAPEGPSLNLPSCWRHQQRAWHAVAVAELSAAVCHSTCPLRGAQWEGPGPGSRCWEARWPGGVGRVQMLF